MSNGKIFIKPSEKASFEGYGGSAEIIIPATGEKFDPKTGTFVRRGGGGGARVTDPKQLIAQRQAVAAAAARAAEEARKKEAERKRVEELKKLSREKVALTQKQLRELMIIRRQERRQQQVAWSKLSEAEQRRLRQEDKVRRLEKLRGKGVTLTPRLEEARERIKERKRIQDSKAKEGVQQVQQQWDVEYDPEKRTKTLWEKYLGAEGYVKERITRPIFSAYQKGVEKFTGVDPLSKKFQVAVAPSLIGIGPFGISFGSEELEKVQKEYKELGGGISLGGLEDIRDRPLKQVALYGIGAGVGFVASAVVSGATAISPVVGTATKIGVTTAGVGLTGLYATQLAGRISLAESPFEAGKIIGVSAKDVGLLGLGGVKGQRGYMKFEGWWRTRGRDIIPLEKLTPTEIITGEKTFPTAPTKQHLRLFKTSPAGRYLGEEAGAFHTTPQKFWKGRGLFTPEKGTSELAGLYGSSYISPHFTKISGVSGGKYKLFGFDFAGRPGIAYLKPKGFRTSPFKRVDGKFVWASPTKKGWADIPLMKTEIEAVFRPGAGSYAFETGKFYTKIKGVRVPIDVFKFETGTGVPSTSLAGTGGIKLTGGAISYSGVPSTSLITPSGGIGLGLYSSAKPSKVSTPPITSYISSYKAPKISSYVSPSKVSRRKIPPIKKLALSSYLKPSRSYRGFVPPPPSRYYRKRVSRSYTPLGRRTSSMLGFKFKPTEEKPLPGVSVFLRRFGKFKLIGAGLTPRRAFQVGREAVETGLGATFKFKGLGKYKPKVPVRFRAKPTPSGLEIIQKKQFRLSSFPERKEIQVAKRRKRK